MKLATDPPVKLYNSLFILQKCDTVIQRIISRTVGTNEGQLDLIVDQFELVDNSTLILLQLCIFLDEYENYFHRVELHYQQKVLIFKKIIKPIVDQIKKWTDLRTFRNRMIAHNCRDSQGNFHLPDIGLYNVPHSALDFHYASDYMKYITKLMMEEFNQEMYEMAHYILQFVPPVRSSHDTKAYNKSVDEMTLAVNSMCQHYHKPYRLTDITKYLPPEE